MTKIIFGILPDSSSAETALNNFSEADFDEKDISIVMNNEKRARTIADDVGPLKGVKPNNIMKKLKGLGVPDYQSSVYQSSIQEGRVVIAIKTDADSVHTAEEMLKDYNTQQVLVV